MSRYRHIGLTREPFGSEPDLAFQAAALGQTDALARLADFATTRGSVALLLGAAGLGKSMVRLALSRDLAVQPGLRMVTLDRPDEWSTDVALLRAVALALGGETNGRTTLDLLTEIETRLTAITADDHWPLLLIDDAHRLTSSQLELLRTISSLEPHSVSLILFAEPELEERIARRRSLESRVELRHTLNPLNSTDAIAMLQRRLVIAGNTEGDEPFDRTAREALVARSGGNPARLLELAARAVDLAARRNIERIDRALVNDAAGYRPNSQPIARQIAFDLIGIETNDGA